jgi:hypothetical protein
MAAMGNKITDLGRPVLLQNLSVVKVNGCSSSRLANAWRGRKWKRVNCVWRKFRVGRTVEWRVQPTFLFEEEGRHGYVSYGDRM